jgi:hypothetical protein
VVVRTGETRAEARDTAWSLAAGVLDELDELTGALVAVIVEQNPGYRPCWVLHRMDARP